MVSNQISEPTRRNIADELTLRKLDPAGRLDEVAFLSRLFNLQELPTTDYRRHEFPNMAADVWQHRVNNSDWGDGWFWTTAGSEFRREQLRDPALASIPVVVLSGADQDRVSDLRVEVAFQKPIQLTELVAELRRICDRQ